MEKEKDMRWHVLSSEYLFRRPWLTARRDHVVLPNGNANPDYYVLEYPDFVNVIALTADGHMLVERQYRHGAGITGWELPAGCVEQGETPLAAIQRELLEETGYAGGEWSKLMELSPNASACNNTSHSFLALGVADTGSRHLEPTEDIEVHLLTEEEVFSLLLRGEFHQAMMAAPLWKHFALAHSRRTPLSPHS